MDVTTNILAEALGVPSPKLAWLAEELLGQRQVQTHAEAMSLAVLWKAHRRGHFPKQLKAYVPSLLAHCRSAHWLDLPADLIAFPVDGHEIHRIPESTTGARIDEADYFSPTSVRKTQQTLLRYLVFSAHQLREDPETPLPGGLAEFCGPG